LRLNLSEKIPYRLFEKVATEIRRKILVRSQVEIVSYGDLPRTERKSRRVFDDRK